MAAVPLKPAYGPTLAQLLASRWGRASRLLRPLVLLLGVAAVALVIAGVLTLLPATISHGGPVPFHFDYKGLYRGTPDPGGYVKVSRRRHGLLEDSLAVEPLRLPPYSGSITGELPLYAASYIDSLARRDPGFVLEGEGKTRVNTVPGYNVYYTTLVEGRRLWGRNILLLPERAGVRQGVAIVILTSPKANAEVKSVLEIATAGVLQRPVHTFTFD
jgi:hypothetical protein